MILKTTFLFIAILCYSTVYSQNTTSVKQIDALVNQINTSDFKTRRDTIKNDQPQLGLSILTYLTMITDGTELKKYVNNVATTTRGNGPTRQMVGTTTFYFDRNKLIKVEESAIQGDKRLDALWYFADDKPIYYIPKSDKARERALLLLKTANNMVDNMRLK